MTDLHRLYLRWNSSLVGVFFQCLLKTPSVELVPWTSPSRTSVWFADTIEVVRRIIFFLFPTTDWFRICHFPVSIHQSASLCGFTINMKNAMWQTRRGGGGDRQDDLRSQSHPAIHAEQDDFSSCDGESVWFKWKLWKRSSSRFISCT